MESDKPMKVRKKPQKLQLQVPRHTIKNERFDIRQSVGEELHHLDIDKTIVTDENEKRRRRTVELHNTNGTWGFTLQTYAVRIKRTGRIDVTTYIDYVETDSPAWVGGIRRGDIILAVNGQSVEHHTHRQLVKVIRECGETMRLVVLFDDCCRKVELHDRFFKLKALLRSKLKEVKALEEKERQIRECVPYLNRSDASRSSLISTATCSSVASWDRFSMLSAPYSIEDMRRPNYGSKENFLDNDWSDSASEADSPFYTDDDFSMEDINKWGKIHKNKPVHLLKYKLLGGNFLTQNLPSRNSLPAAGIDASGGNFHRKIPLSSSCVDLRCGIYASDDKILKGKSSSQKDIRNNRDNSHDFTPHSAKCNIKNNNGKIEFGDIDSNSVKTQDCNVPIDDDLSKCNHDDSYVCKNDISINVDDVTRGDSSTDTACLSASGPIVTITGPKASCFYRTVDNQLNMDAKTDYTKGPSAHSSSHIELNNNLSENNRGDCTVQINDTKSNSNGKLPDLISGGDVERKLPCSNTENSIGNDAKHNNVQTSGAMNQETTHF